MLKKMLTLTALVAAAATLSGTATAGSFAKLTFAYGDGSRSATEMAGINQVDRGTFLLSMSDRGPACPGVSSIRITRTDDENILLTWWTATTVNEESLSSESSGRGLLISGPIKACPNVTSLRIALS